MTTKRERIVFENLYEQIPKEDKEDITFYPNEDQLQIELPFQMSISASSGAGKTNWCLQLIKHIGVFKHIYIIAKDINETLYKKFEQAMEPLVKKSKNKIKLVMSDNLKDVPAVTSLDGSFNSLVVVDDFTQASKKDLEPVQEIYIMGRKHNISVIFIGHRYYELPKLLRGNTSYVVINKLRSEKEFDRIIRELSVDKSVDELRNIYHYIMNKGMEHAFLIDMKTRNPNLIYRMDYTPINELEAD